MSRALASLLLVLCIPVLGALMVSCSESSGASATAPASSPGALLVTAQTDVNNSYSYWPSVGTVLSNQWIAGSLLLRSEWHSAPSFGPLPLRLAANKAYSATVQIQTATGTSYVDAKPGPPMQGGNLVVDCDWLFSAGSPESPAGNITIVKQSGVLVIPVVLRATLFGRKTAPFGHFLWHAPRVRDLG